MVTFEAVLKRLRGGHNGSIRRQAVFVRTQRNGERVYLLVVENRWVDRLVESGELDLLTLLMQRE